MLPPGWLQKPIIGESKKFKYLSPEYTEFKTLVDVHQFMKSNNFGREILKKVEENLGVKGNLQKIVKNFTPPKKWPNFVSGHLSHLRHTYSSPNFSQEGGAGVGVKFFTLFF